MGPPPFPREETGSTVVSTVDNVWRSGRHLAVTDGGHLVGAGHTPAAALVLK